MRFRTRPPANPGARMSLSGHFAEFRKRLFWAAAGLVPGVVVGWFFSDWVLNLMRAPLAQIANTQGRDAALNFTDISEAFDLRIQIAITLGVVMSSPVWLYQAWAFLAPGLVRKEKVYGLSFILTAVPLFLIGCAVGWLVLPNMVHVLTSFAPSDSTSLISASNYYDFVLKLSLAVGIAFVLPVFLVILNFVGVLSAASIIRSWRIAVVVALMFAAVATPSVDVYSMFLLAVPIIGLYFASAGVAWFNDRRRKRIDGAFDRELAYSETP